MQISPVRLAILHTRTARSLLAAGKRKHAARKLKQARRAIQDLADPRFKVASRFLSEALRGLKRHDGNRFMKRCEAVIQLLAGPFT